MSGACHGEGTWYSRFAPQGASCFLRHAQNLKRIGFMDLRIDLDSDS